jgi:hypothetical protein
VHVLPAGRDEYKGEGTREKAKSLQLPTEAMPGHH